MNKSLAVLLLIALAGGALWLTQRPVDHGPGVLAPESPRQATLAGIHPVTMGGWQVTPVASYELEARVLSKHSYRFDKTARLSPVDLALGWGPMSDETVIEKLDIRQSGRCFRWRAKELPLPIREIGRHSANTHIIPANGLVRSRLRWVREGHVVRIKGYLVMATDGKGGHWVSSTRRDDSGDGACEIVLVEDLEYR